MPTHAHVAENTVRCRQKKEEYHMFERESKRWGQGMTPKLLVLQEAEKSKSMRWSMMTQNVGNVWMSPSSPVVLSPTIVLLLYTVCVTLISSVSLPSFVHLFVKPSFFFPYLGVLFVSFSDIHNLPSLTTCTALYATILMFCTASVVSFCLFVSSHCYVSHTPFSPFIQLTLILMTASLTDPVCCICLLFSLFLSH